MVGHLSFYLVNNSIISSNYAGEKCNVRNDPLIKSRPTRFSPRSRSHVYGRVKLVLEDHGRVLLALIFILVKYITKTVSNFTLTTIKRYSYSNKTIVCNDKTKG